jgi:hypothetical protein
MIDIKEVLVYNIPFKVEFVKIENWKYGQNAYFNVSFKNVVYSIKIPYDIRYNISEMIISKIKENRILKGLITKEINKRYKLKLKEVLK